MRAATTSATFVAAVDTKYAQLVGQRCRNSLCGTDVGDDLLLPEHGADWSVSFQRRGHRADEHVPRHCKEFCVCGVHLED